jgi:hypothetical protein
MSRGGPREHSKLVFSALATNELASCGYKMKTETVCRETATRGSFVEFFTGFVNRPVNAGWHWLFYHQVARLGWHWFSNLCEHSESETVDKRAFALK